MANALRGSGSFCMLLTLVQVSPLLTHNKPLIFYRIVNPGKIRSKARGQFDNLRPPEFDNYTLEPQP